MNAVEKLAAEISARTGWTGKKLTDAVMFYCMVMADVQGNAPAADHFERRLRERMA